MIEWIVSSCVLIAVEIGLRFLLRGKISARLQYALWALVLVRLLMPSGIFETDFSVENVLTSIQSQPAVQNVISDIQKPAISYEDAYEQAESELLPEKDQPGDLPDVEAVQPGEDAVVRRAAQIMKLSTASFVLHNILYGIWCIGIAVVALCFLLSNINFARMLKRNRSLLSTGRINIYTCESLETPCLFGLVKPAIYLTSEDAADEMRSRHILAHEHTHFRHLDHIWSVLRCVCLALHWYNPLVWIAAILSRRDSELACDEATIQQLGENERIPYGQTLVKTTCTAKATTGLLGIATTMTGSMAAIKERVVIIAKKTKFSIYALVSVILIASITMGFTCSGGNSGNDMVTVFCVTQSETVNLNTGTSYTLSYEYDEMFNLTLQELPGGFTDAYRYDENNRCTYADVGDQVFHYSYDDHGVLVRKKVGNPYNSTLSHNYVYTYDSNGRLISRTDEAAYNQEVTTYTYDFRGILLSSKTENPSNPKLIIYKEYNAQGNMTSHKQYYDGTVRLHETYTYDLWGRLLTHERIDLGVLTYRLKATYDLAGRLIKVVTEADRSFDAMLGNDHEVVLTPETTTYRYDLRGNPVEELHTLSSGDPYSYNRTYDINGKLISVDRGQTRTEYTYDAHGNVISEFTYSAGKLWRITTYTYTAVQVRWSDAERLWVQQKDVVGTDWMPSLNVPELEI